MATCPKCSGDLPKQRRECPYCGADTTWWLSRDGEVYGPYDEKTVRYIVRDRRAELDDPAMIGREGTWRPLGELLGDSPPQPSPTPTAAGAQKRQEDPRRYWTVGGWLLFVAVLLMVCVTVGGVIVWPTYQKLATRDHRARSRAHLKQIYLALKLHAHESGGRLPAPGQWMDTLESFLGEERARTPGGQPYWVNEALGKETLSELAQRQPPPVLAAEPAAMDATRAEGEFLCLRADGKIAPETAEQIQAAASGP